MTVPTRPPTTSGGVRRITLEHAGIPLSGLLIEPRHVPPRAVVVCLHGGGMSAAYFDGQAHPDLSLLTLGARLGYTVLALDRPGYGESAAVLPEGQSPAEQAVTLRGALRGFAATHDTGAGLFLVAHSYGGKVALTMAADWPAGELIGLDVSGCGSRYVAEAARHIGAPGRTNHMLNWGPLRLYPPGTFRSSATVVSPVPARERQEWRSWPERYRRIAARLRLPVRLTFAEHEAWWHHDEAAIDELTRPLAAPHTVDRLPDAGHNISLGWSARAYHLRVLAFLEECLAAKEAKVTGRSVSATSTGRI
ncbi:alpha/beta hydrolase [Streptomyces sp. Je 1-79]|uniref:alpha/beta hydrolase family protein n=1 Tax=Streptomyces sp. Je 1-79 TaxID=2943847 RepID=UPI0021A2BF7B|nr:alpha/beta hydrolase [Streptomyces sp. Je 1-79]MCT4356444.1 alpha/beta hydrolase [Streptomyces sp. Je 1-79]